MTHAEHDDVADRAAAPRGRSRRTKALIGVGLAAVLGGGAVLATQWGGDRDGTTASETGALSPLTAEPVPATGDPSADSSAGPSASAPPSSATAKGAPGGPPAATPMRSKSKEEAIADVKGSAAEAATQVQRPVTSLEVAEADVTVDRIASEKDRGGSLTVYSADQDLTGKRELAWVAGQAGEKVGTARCSQKISLVAGAEPRERKTLLVCWRTSDAKSVYTVAVNPAGRPSVDRSVAALNKVWNG
jgi:hypothetical protein